MTRPISILLLLWALAVGTAVAQVRFERTQGGQGGGQRQQQQRDHGDFHRHQGPHAGDWLRRNKDLPPDQQQKALESDPAFRSLPPDRQQQLRERLREFNNRPPAERERIIQRMDAWDHLTPDQRTRARDMFARFRALPADRRQTLVQAFRSLREMSPADRERALNSPQFSGFNGSERELLRGMTELNIGPGRRHGPGEPQ